MTADRSKRKIEGGADTGGIPDVASVLRDSSEQLAAAAEVAEEVERLGEDVEYLLDQTS